MQIEALNFRKYLNITYLPFGIDILTPEEITDNLCALLNLKTVLREYNEFKSKIVVVF